MIEEIDYKKIINLAENHEKWNIELKDSCIYVWSKHEEEYILFVHTMKEGNTISYAYPEWCSVLKGTCLINTGDNDEVAIFFKSCNKSKFAIESYDIKITNKGQGLMVMFLLPEEPKIQGIKGSKLELMHTLDLFRFQLDTNQ